MKKNNFFRICIFLKNENTFNIFMNFSNKTLINIIYIKISIIICNNLTNNKLRIYIL